MKNKFFLKMQEPVLPEKTKAVDVYTLKELAEIFKVSQRTIYNWLYRLKISYVKIGSKTYVTEKQLQQFLDAHSIECLNYGRA